MKKILREINERCQKENLFSYEGLLFLFALVGIPKIISLFIPVNKQAIGIFYIGLGLLLFIENYYYQNNLLKQDEN